MRAVRTEKVKICATVGPASLERGVLARLIEAGVDAIRINGSHAPPEDVQSLVSKVRAASKRAGHDVAVLLDLPGPKYRIGDLDEPMRLEEGQSIRLAPKPGPGTIPIALRGNVRKLRKGDDVFLDDGFLRLRVSSNGKSEIRCKVVVGGLLTSRAGLNLPGVAVRTPVPTPKDIAHMKAGRAASVDLFALSFVQRAKDLNRCRKYAGGIPLIAKIERPEAVADIERVAMASNGIMVARGDLAVEMQPEELPVLQKRLIRAANLARKPVIVATEMLASMTHAPRPTRAELTDVGNAVLDGADAVMLSEETAVGVNPVRAVRVMGRILQKVETSLYTYDLHPRTLRGVAAERPDWAVADAAVETAVNVRAKAIVAVTGSGRTAMLISARRPSVPLFAFAPDPAVRRRVAFMWGVVAHPVKPIRDPDRLIEWIVKYLANERRLKAGDRIVVSFGSPIWEEGTKTNSLRIAIV